MLSTQSYGRSHKNRSFLTLSQLLKVISRVSSVEDKPNGRFILPESFALSNSSSDLFSSLADQDFTTTLVLKYLQNDIQQTLKTILEVI